MRELVLLLKNLLENSQYTCNGEGKDEDTDDAQSNCSKFSLKHFEDTDTSEARSQNEILDCQKSPDTFQNWKAGQDIQMVEANPYSLTRPKAHPVFSIFDNKVAYHIEDNDTVAFGYGFSGEYSYEFYHNLSSLCCFTNSCLKCRNISFIQDDQQAVYHLSHYMSD